MTAHHNPRAIRSPAWLLSGLTRSVAGELTLTNGRIVFETRDGARLLDAALSELTSATFPWYYFGGGMKLRIGSETYRLSFARPGNLPEYSAPDDGGDMRSSRQSGAEWKAALTALMTPR